MARCDQATESTRTSCSVINPGINGVVVKAFAQYGKGLGYSGEQADQSVPEISVQKIEQMRDYSTAGDEGVFVELVDPHFVFEKSEQAGLGTRQRIDFTGIAIHQPAKPNARRDQSERQKKHRLNERTEVNARWFALKIGVEPRPGRGEHEGEKNRAQSKDNKRYRHYPRTFVRAEHRPLARAPNGDVLRCCRCFTGVELPWAHRLEVCAPSGTKKNVDDLPSHVERSENHSGEHQVVRQSRDGPMRRRVQDFFFRPTTRKEERNAAQVHHADGVSEKCHRHGPAQAAHFADVLFMMKSVND